MELLHRYQQNTGNDMDRLRIPTGRRQTFWLCTNADEELNQGLPETNPAGDQTLNSGSPDMKSIALTT